MHKRLFPRLNTFSYNVYYLALPLPAPTINGIFTGFHPKDVGKRNGEDPLHWARDILREYGLDNLIKEIVLITMPKILGYVFNPVSFYMCLDEERSLRAVICEVHNTFGEQHTYLCAHPDHRPITTECVMEADKLFHVSPFLNRAGHYTFRFSFSENHLSVGIDHYDQSGEKQLVTTLVGKLSPLTPQSLRSAFWKHPMVTFKAIALIHYQAIKLVAKGIRYISRPAQFPTRISATRNLNKM